MLKIIQLPSMSEKKGDEINRADIIDKISNRTNFQNPIKKWDLASNDRFQNEVSQFFRKKKLFYERRQKEWSERSSQLKGAGIKKGPNIKEMTQLIASFHYKIKDLGPANAKQGVSHLFEQKSYEVIKKTAIEKIYQIYLLDNLISDGFNSLLKTQKYRNYKGHIRFALFSIIVMLSDKCGWRWGNPQLTNALEYYTKKPKHKEVNALMRMVKSSIGYIHSSFKKCKSLYKRKSKRDLTLNNYFKTKNYIDELFSKRLPYKMISEAKKLTKVINTIHL
jgi:hypothetical protein